jgi:hypothetical protein
MDFYDLSDYMDQDISAGQFPTADSGPIAQFLTEVPDWMNMTQEDLNLALDSLPNSLKGPISPGMSLQEAIQVTKSILHT